MSGKSPCSFLRNNPLGNPSCRSVTRSPVDFREGRRASDGLVAQGILNSSDQVLNSGVAFNSQRLHEACKAKGVLELHLLQQEAAQLTSQYQSSVPIDELTVRQQQHSQFHVSPSKDLNSLYHYKNPENGGYYNKVDLSAYVGLLKNELSKQDMDLAMKHMKVDQSALQKPPLQQQLMQHRLLQQKRQILQKQCAMEAGLSRRQMLRQQSYKIAQTQQIMPPLPLPLSEKETEDLLAFQQTVEGPNSVQTNGNVGVNMGSMGNMGHGGHSPKMLKTGHPSPALSPQPGDGSGCIWNNLPNSMQTCQISEGAALSATHESWPLYQVYYR